MTTSEMFGPYRLESLLGRGGMGEVHRAFDTEHQRTVALKTLAPHLADDEEFQSRFRREARHVAKLRNPHVIPIHRYGQIDGRLFIDMRYVEGPDLGDLVHSDGALPPRRAVAFVEQVASALDAAHASDLVHRDVKPSNVLVDATVAEFVYLVDFGITRSATTQKSYSLTRTGALLGSLDYMAPEQFDGVVSRRSDVYGLTCILYELLTATKPYQGEGLAVLMRSHLTTPPPAPSNRDPALSAFDDVVATGMAKLSEQRYSTAGELAAAARAALGSTIGEPSGVVQVRVAPTPVTESPDVPMTLVETDEPDDGASGRASVESSSAEPPSPTPSGPNAAGGVAATGRRAESRTEPIVPRPRGSGTPPRAETSPFRLLGGGPPGGRPAHRSPEQPGRPPGPGQVRSPRISRAVLALAALALVAATTAAVLAATSERVPLPPVGQPSSQPVPATTTTAPGLELAPGAIRQAIFTGRTDDGVALTIVIGDSMAMAYLCDGSAIEAWLRGEILPNNVVQLNNPRTGSVLQATVNSSEARGEFLAGSTSRTFTVAANGAESVGLYEAATQIDGQEYRVGWVVLGEDDTEGIMTRGSEILPAPHLDTDGPTTTIEGRTVTVKKHNGDGPFAG